MSFRMKLRTGPSKRICENCLTFNDITVECQLNLPLCWIKQKFTSRINVEICCCTVWFIYNNWNSPVRCRKTFVVRCLPPAPSPPPLPRPKEPPYSCAWCLVVLCLVLAVSQKHDRSFNPLSPKIQIQILTDWSPYISFKNSWKNLV